ncbi:MAG TPA: protease complex subunit PrcB family protein [Anaerolineales bacterium]|nr:protease complex subunit PrcB family protein [Anaerolineales bacterium]
MKRTSPLLACFIVTLYAFLLAACVPPLPEDGSLTFQTLEQKNDSAYSLQEQYTALEPALIVIENEEARARYEVWFGEKGRKSLADLNFGTRLAIGVFQGWKTSGGYGVEIERITREGDVVTVTARFTETRLNGPANAITSPYQLVRVNKAGDWNAGITYELVVAGEVVAVFPTPEP